MIWFAQTLTFFIKIRDIYVLQIFYNFARVAVMFFIYAEAKPLGN